MYRIVKVVLIVAGAFALFAAGSFAQAPQTLMYQGKLATATGPVSSPVSVTFRIYDALTAGTLLWSETHGSLTPNELGVFTVELGSITLFGEEVFDGSVRYLGITVGADEEMTPRQLITSVPYSIQARVPGFANVWKDYAPVTSILEGKDTLEIRVPGPGHVVVDITGNFYANHLVGVTGWIIATIDTLPAVTDWDSWAYRSFDAEEPTGYYAVPYASTRVVPVDAAGLYVFYLNTQWSGLNSANIQQSNFKAVYYPAFLGTESPAPPESSAPTHKAGPGTIDDEQ